MAKVAITGWNKGLNKIQLNHLLQRRSGCGLREAKRSVDDLLAGEILTYEFPDDESASAFCRSATEVGAVCSIVDEGSTGKWEGRVQDVGAREAVRGPRPD